jgi:hypothetical protein
MFDGAFIGDPALTDSVFPSTVLENVYRRRFRQRTLSDLLDLPLDKSEVLVHPVLDNPIYKDIDWDTKLEAAFKRYLAYPKSPQWWRKGWDRKFDRRIDQFRWKLHLKLMDWGIII